MNTSTSNSKAWWQRRFCVWLSLALLYPLGLALLWRRPTKQAWRKPVTAIIFLPVFALFVLLLLKPYWDFPGSLSLAGFRLDFDRGRSRDQRVEQHRARQSAQTPTASAPDGSSGASWTDFRGPRRDGMCEETDLNLDWTAHPPRELYRQPVGQSYAGFVVSKGRAYTLEQRRDQEAVVAYELLTGREGWTHAWRAAFTETLGGDGPRATPTLAGDRLYALGAEGHLHCLDAISGSVHWSRNILDEFGASNLHWGLSGSPLVVDGRVYVTSSGKGGPGVLALDAETGKTIWQSNEAGVQCYSSLALVTLAGRRHLLNLADAAIQGIDPADGNVMWRYPWEMVGGPSCAQPLAVAPNRVFVSSGYGKGAALLEITPYKDGTSLTAKKLWSNTRMKNKFASSVIRDGYVYGLDEGVLCCLKLETGERRWKGGRYGHGSLLLVGDQLMILGEAGELAIVPAEPDGCRETARLQALTGRTWNNFTIAGGILLVRNHKEMAAYDLRPIVASRG